MKDAGHSKMEITLKSRLRTAVDCLSKDKMKLTSAISPPPRKQRPARLVAAAARVAVAAVLSDVNWTSSGFNSLKVIIVPRSFAAFLCTTHMQLDYKKEKPLS